MNKNMKSENVNQVVCQLSRKVNNPGDEESHFQDIKKHILKTDEGDEQLHVQFFKVLNKQFALNLESNKKMVLSGFTLCYFDDTE